MATTFTRALAILVVAAATLGSTRCGRDAAPPATTSGTPGGELVASLRSEPANYNRYFEATAPADLVALLTHARLVVINRATDALEPALAESWQTSPDGKTLTLTLRPGVTFSDGVPFTAADVLFSFAVAYDAPGSVLGDALVAGGKRLHVTSPDPRTVVIRLPEPFAPGVRLLDNLPILPRHKLEPALRDGTIRTAWTPAKPLTDIAGLGPFVLTGHVAGQRLVFTRNPHYWRREADGRELPLLDRLTVEIVPEPNAEALRLEAAATDLMAAAEIRTDDYARFKRAADQGRLKLLDIGVSLDPNLLWFNLKPPARDPKPWLRKTEFRQALSAGADRDAIVNTVYLGAAVPIFGPVTPRNTTWHAPPPRQPHDPAKARQLLAAAGLTDRNNDGMLEDAAGRPVRFSILVQAGHTVRTRTVSVLQDQFRKLGVTTDVVSLDVGSIIGRWQKGEYDAIFHGFQQSATDPAMTLDFWLSSGGMHFWNPSQPKPATPWEAQIDDLMRRQVSSTDLAERQRLFAEVQRILGEHAPALYFAAPKVTVAMSPRVANATPAPQIPQILWRADTLAVAGTPPR